MRNATKLFRIPGCLLLTLRLEFGGGGGASTAAPPPPAPPAPPRPATATASSRTILANLMPKRSRASTVLTGAPAASGPTSGNTTRTILGSPLA